MNARIEYTVERKGQAVRKAKEVPSNKVETTIEQLIEKQNAFNFAVRYDARMQRADIDIT